MGCLSRGAGAGQMAELHLAGFRMWLVQYSPHDLSTCVCACMHTHTGTHIHVHTPHTEAQSQAHIHACTHRYTRTHARTHARIRQFGATHGPDACTGSPSRSHLPPLPVLGPSPQAPRVLPSPVC